MDVLFFATLFFATDSKAVLIRLEARGMSCGRSLAENSAHNAYHSLLHCTWQAGIQSFTVYAYVMINHIKNKRQVNA